MLHPIVSPKDKQPNSWHVKLKKWMRVHPFSYRSKAMKAINSTRNSLTINEKKQFQNIVLNKARFGGRDFNQVMTNLLMLKQTRLQNNAMRVINRVGEKLGLEKRKELVNRVHNAKTFTERNYEKIVGEALRHKRVVPGGLWPSANPRNSNSNQSYRTGRSSSSSSNCTYYSFSRNSNST